jgi:hypothetical protein
LYSPVLGGGLILRIVGVPALDEPALDELRDGEPALDEPEEDEPALDKLGENEPALDELWEDEMEEYKPALGELGEDEPAWTSQSRTSWPWMSRGRGGSRWLAAVTTVMLAM